MEITIAIIIALVLVIIFICMSFQNTTAKFYDDFISGYWVGDQEFLDKSGLNDLNMLIVRKKNKDEPEEYEGYIVMTDSNDNIIISSGFDLNLEKKTTISNMSVRKVHKFKGHFTFDEKISSLDDMSNFDLTLSVIDGSLTISNDEKVYAYMVKDNAASRTSKLAYDSSSESEDD